MHYYYILEGKTPIPVEMHTWSKWFEETETPHVGLTEQGEVTVSTVFLGLNHNFMGEGEPILFETMVFGGE